MTEQVTLLTGRTVSVEEAREILEVDPIIRRFGTWAVTEYGIECLTTRYSIAKDRVHESDWRKHMVGDSQARGHWVVGSDFLGALSFARVQFPIKAVPRPTRAEAPTTPGVTRRPRRQSLSNRLRFLVMKRDRYACQLCGRSAQQGYQLQVDHKLARSRGGSDELDNLWVLCSLCNNGKGTEDL